MESGVEVRVTESGLGWHALDLGADSLVGGDQGFKFRVTESGLGWHWGADSRVGGERGLRLEPGVEVRVTESGLGWHRVQTHWLEVRGSTPLTNTMSSALRSVQKASNSSRSRICSVAVTGGRPAPCPLCQESGSRVRAGVGIGVGVRVRVRLTWEAAVHQPEGKCSTVGWRLGLGLGLPGRARYTNQKGRTAKKGEGVPFAFKLWWH